MLFRKQLSGFSGSQSYDAPGQADTLWSFRGATPRIGAGDDRGACTSEWPTLAA